MSKICGWLFVAPFFLLIACTQSKTKSVSTVDHIDTLHRSFVPAPTPQTHPDSFLYQYEVLPCLTDSTENPFYFYFEDTLHYSAVEGVTTFRGNNYRDGVMYGRVAANEKQLEKIWTNKVGRIDKWTGVGWTGQPVVIKWDKKTLAGTNVLENFKEEEGFTEVICASLDGKVHFYDLYSGDSSRPVISLPSSLKGGVWIDPRGYPLLYVGQGIDKKAGKTVAIGFYIYSLLDGKQLAFVNGIDDFAFRKWGAFDGNGLVCAESDCLFLVGENGLVYAAKLHTQFDEEKATISINPQWYKCRYKTVKNSRSRLLGTENSVAAYRNYAFFADNGGMLQCMDMNTLKPVWVRYVDDDTDASVALEEEESGVFLYTGCEVDLRQKADSAYLRKINAETGGIVWEKSYLCSYDSINGGLLASPLIGKNSLDELVFFNVARTGGKNTGKLLAINKSDGSLAWEYKLDKYSWSSPVAVYNENGEGFVIVADSGGNLHLLDGEDGTLLHALNLSGENIEASPVVYNDILVVGTRGRKIHGVRIK